MTDQARELEIKLGLPAGYFAAMQGIITQKRDQYFFNHPSDEPKRDTRPACLPPVQEYKPPPPTESEWIKLRPLVVTAAWRAGLGGAIRLWLLGKHLDRDGAGVLAVDELKVKARALGVTQRHFDAWLKAGIRAGFFKPVRQGKVLRLSSLARVAHRCKARQIDARYIQVGLKELFGADWRSRVWGGLVAGKTISRASLETLTGITPGGQRALEKDGIRTTPNYAKTQRRPTELDGVREYVKPHAFLARDDTVSWRLPNSYTTHPNLATIGRRGAIRRVRKEYNVLAGDSINKARVPTEQPKRIFFAKPDDRRNLPAAELAARKRDEFTAGEIYARRPVVKPWRRNWRYPDARLWDVVPTGLMPYA